MGPRRASATGSSTSRSATTASAARRSAPARACRACATASPRSTGRSRSTARRARARRCARGCRRADPPQLLAAAGRSSARCRSPRSSRGASSTTRSRSSSCRCSASSAARRRSSPARSRSRCSSRASAGIGVGRYLDRHGPRALMTAGSVAGRAAGARVVAGRGPRRAITRSGSAIGLVMATVLYEPAFTRAGEVVPGAGERRRALTALTLVAGIVELHLPAARPGADRRARLARRAARSSR